jgi:hypothetical protein
MMWRYYVPDNWGKDEPSVEDMRELPGSHANAWCAAQAAVEDDWDNCDGWERGCDKPFDLVVVSPGGQRHRFVGNNEATVSHGAAHAEGER